MTIKGLILIMMGGVLINNYVLQQFLGICPFLGVSKKVDTAAGMGGAVIFVIAIASLVSPSVGAGTVTVIPFSVMYVTQSK